MDYVVAAPGSCGEFIQGYAGDSSFMVTCPVDRYAVAGSRIGAPRSALPEKSSRARTLTLSYLGMDGLEVDVSLASDIPVGKGMASSTADISAVCQATALACGRVLSGEDIARIAISIEPSDATFYPGIVAFDYRRGILLKEYGECPSMQILVYDCGGEVDTMAFNRQENLVQLQKQNEEKIQTSVDLFRRGMETGDIDQIGKAAAISALANQSILYKEALPLFYEQGMAAGGRGVVAAHSGTVLGLLLAKEDDAEAVRRELDARMAGAVRFLDLVNVTNAGMKILKR